MLKKVKNDELQCVEAHLCTLQAIPLALVCHMIREDVVMMFSKIVYFYFLVLLYDDMGTNIRPELVVPRFGAPRLGASGLGVSELGVSGFFLSRSFSNRQ